MTETVKLWVEKFINSNTTIEEEIKEVEGAISNERLWEKGSSTEEEANDHRSNIRDLEEYLECLKDMKVDK